MNSTPVPAAEGPTETRRDQILKAAAAVFAEKGYQRATMKEIATRTGIVPGTIYLYFENKRDLLLAIADQLIGQAWGETMTMMADLAEEAYIAAVLRNALQFARQNKALLLALAPEIWTDDELQSQFFSRIMAPLFETGAHYLSAQIEEGKARSCQVEIVIPTIAGSLFILAALRALASEDFLADFSDDELVDELTRLYFYGLRLNAEEAAG